MSVQAKSTTTAIFPGYDTIATGIYLLEPSCIDSNNRSQCDSGDAPSLIILCTWMGGATARRIQKYLSMYHEIFPTSAILLLRTMFLDITFRPFKSYRAKLAPAREIIKRITGQSAGEVLLQAFSHGGCNTAIQLALSLRDENFRIPLRCVVFDCCPGDSAFKRLYHAARLSLPTNTAVRLIGPIAIVPVIGTISTLQSNGILHSVAELRRDMNHPEVFSSGTRRLYLYSEADQAVQWQDVERHMAEARSQGWIVRGVKFRHSAHCAIVMDYKVEYLQAIKDCWNGHDDVADRREVPAPPLQSKL